MDWTFKNENRYDTRSKNIVVHIEFFPDGDMVKIRVDGEDKTFLIAKELALKLFEPAP